MIHFCIHFNSFRVDCTYFLQFLMLMLCVGVTINKRKRKKKYKIIDSSSWDNSFVNKIHTEKGEEEGEDTMRWRKRKLYYTN